MITRRAKENRRLLPAQRHELPQRHPLLAHLGLFVFVLFIRICLLWVLLFILFVFVLCVCFFAV